MQELEKEIKKGIEHMKLNNIDEFTVHCPGLFGSYITVIINKRNDIKVIK